MFIRKRKLKSYINYAIKRTIKELFMELKVFSIKDTLTGNFSALTCAVNDGVIIRDLMNMLKTNKDSELSINAKDKDLYCLGTFDVDTGILTSDVKFIGHLVDYKEAE